MTDAPRLLVEWSSPWQEFVSAVGPALRRSPPRLRLEAQVGLFPWRGILVVLLLEIAAALATAVARPIGTMQTDVSQDPPRPHDVIYFSADELPRTADLGGAQTGASGKSGGSSVHHPVQTIKVARGASLRERVTDAPQLDLPKSNTALKNLLAYKADPGPVPVDAVKLMRQARPMAMTAAVVPPTPQVQENTFRRDQLATPVVAPPPVDPPAQSISARRNLPLAAAVVPPPVAALPQALNHPARLMLPAGTVVAPPPEIEGATRSRIANEVLPPVVPPPVELNALRTSTLSARLSGNQRVAPPPVELQGLRQHTTASLGGTSVAPPPAELSSGLRARPSLIGNATVAPPTEVHTVPVKSPGEERALSPSTGVIVSSRPGDKPGQPANPERATLAMSPTGSATLGAGGEGGGAGITRGGGSGSSSAAAGSGAASAGVGKGADASPHTGSSPLPGPGGAGNRNSGSPRVPGVSVSGGSNVVTLPSFGGPSGGGHSDVHAKSNGITVVASPRAGGAMNFYGALKGDRVYTIYFQSAVGTAVMQFADPDSAAHPYDMDLTAPQVIRADLPPDLERSRLIIACVLDRNGLLKHWRVLQSDSHDFSTKVLSELPAWKFSPAFRGSDPVEVNAILGFGVDTK